MTAVPSQMEVKLLTRLWLAEIALAFWSKAELVFEVVMFTRFRMHTAPDRQEPLNLRRRQAAEWITAQVRRLVEPLQAVSEAMNH
jgi:hypothetical protein